MSQLDLSVPEAVQVGNELLQHKLLKPLAKNRPFTDAGGMFYRLQPKKKVRRGLFANVDKSRRRSSWTHSAASPAKGDRAIVAEKNETVEERKAATPREEESESAATDFVVERQRSATVATPGDIPDSDEEEVNDGLMAESSLSRLASKSTTSPTGSPRVVSPFAIPAAALEEAPATARAEGPAPSPKIVEEKPREKEKKSSKKRERSRSKKDTKKETKKKSRRAAKTLAPPSSPEAIAERREATHSHLSALALLYNPTEGPPFSPTTDGRSACDEEAARALVGAASVEALLESGLLVTPQPGRLCLAFAL